MLKHQIKVSFKDKTYTPTGESVALNHEFGTNTGGGGGGGVEVASSNSNSDSKNDNKNCWSGYHVRFRNPRNFQELAIDERFNRWGDMVDYFKDQERPYRLSQGSLKDLLYGTYKRKGKHGVSLNELVSITKIDRVRITKIREDEKNSEETQETESEGLDKDPEGLVQTQYRGVDQSVDMGVNSLNENMLAVSC